MSIDFGDLISNSFNLAWRHKTLWVFGLFTGAGSGGFHLDLPDKFWQRAIGAERYQDMHHFFRNIDISRDMALPVVGAIVMWLLILALLFTVCYLIAQPAIIDAVNKITRGGRYTFGGSFSRGVDFMWRFLGVLIITIMSFLMLIFALVILAIILTPFSLLLTIPAAIVVSFFLWHTFALAEVAIVARDGRIGDAIVEGWELVKRNKVNCLIISLLMIGIGIGFAIAIGIITLFAFLPVGLVVGLITGNIVATLLLGLIIALPISMVLGGYTGTFFNAIYVQFYFKLYEPTPAPAVAGPTAPAV